MENIQLINFIDLSQEEKEMILSWRNTQKIKKWMLTSKEISLGDHLDFIKSLKKSKTKLYFVIKNNKKYLGVINLTEIDTNSCSFGIYKNPETYGVGDILLSTISEYAFETLGLKTILAQVFADNTKAITLYSNHNFFEIGREIYDSKEIINMELRYENR